MQSRFSAQRITQALTPPWIMRTAAQQNMGHPAQDFPSDRFVRFAGAASPASPGPEDPLPDDVFAALPEPQDPFSNDDTLNILEEVLAERFVLAFQALFIAIEQGDWEAVEIALARADAELCATEEDDDLLLAELERQEAVQKLDSAGDNPELTVDNVETFLDELGSRPEDQGMEMVVLHDLLVEAIEERDLEKAQALAARMKEIYALWDVHFT